MSTNSTLTTLTMLLGFGLSINAHADSIDTALIKAYQNNPALNAVRSGFQGTKDEILIANAARRPTITADASGSAVNSHGDSFERGIVGIQVDQLLFDGRATSSRVQVAEAQVAASNQQLESQIQSTLLDAVTAFYDVYRDRSILDVRNTSLEFLGEQVSRAESLFTVGEGTRTDVSLATARKAAADAEASLAKAQLRASESTYVRVIGESATETVIQNLPSTLFPQTIAAAIDMAGKNHPAIVNNELSLEAAQTNARLSRSARAPRLSLSGRVENTTDSFSTGDPREQDGVTGSLALRLTIPLYQGGVITSRNRQADYSVEQITLILADTQAQILSSVSSAWARREAAQIALEASKLQLLAAQSALDGVIKEKEVGLRTTLDVLTVQQDVLNAQIRISTARRDSALSDYSLLASIGQLNPATLSLDVD